MDVSLETTGAISRRMTITVPADQLDSAVTARLTRLARTAKIPGFRPGKVPLKVVEARFSQQALQEAAQELIGASYREAVIKESVETAGPPSIEPKNLARGQDLEFVASFEVFPEIGYVDIKGKKIAEKSCEVGDADVDRTIETLRRQRTTYEAGAEPAKEGDRVVIDFQGTIDGEVFEGGTAKDYPVVLGDGALLEAFDQQLQGAQAGAELTVKLTFPGDYPGVAVAGKDAVFAVTVKEVGKPQVPEIDEAFIRAFGIKDGQEMSLRKEIQAGLERECDQRLRGDTRQAVLEALLEDNEFELPQALVDEEIDRAIMAVREQLRRQGLPADGPIDRSHYLEEACKRVKLGLVLHEIVKRREIKPDGDRVRTRVEEMGANYDDPQQFVGWHYEDPSRLAQVEAAIVEEQVIEELLAEADKVATPVSFEQLMQPALPGAAQSNSAST